MPMPRNKGTYDIEDGRDYSAHPSGKGFVLSTPTSTPSSTPTISAMDEAMYGKNAPYVREEDGSLNLLSVLATALRKSLAPDRANYPYGGQVEGLGQVESPSGEFHGSALALRGVEKARRGETNLGEIGGSPFPEFGRAQSQVLRGVGQSIEKNKPKKKNTMQLLEEALTEPPLKVKKREKKGPTVTITVK